MAQKSRFLQWFSRFNEFYFSCYKCLCCCRCWVLNRASKSWPRWDNCIWKCTEKPLSRAGKWAQVSKHFSSCCQDRGIFYLWNKKQASEKDWPTLYIVTLTKTRIVWIKNHLFFIETIFPFLALLHLNVKFSLLFFFSHATVSSPSSLLSHAHLFS